MNSSKSYYDFFLVDDDDAFRNRMKTALERRGFNVCTASSVDSALQILPQRSVLRAIVDLRMPGESGISLIEPLIASIPEIKIIVLTGHGSIDTAVEAVRRGAIHYLTKPADLDDILLAFEVTEATNRGQNRKQDVVSLQAAEEAHIQQVMQACSGNITKAAEKLGIHRRSLQRKLARQQEV